MRYFAIGSIILLSLATGSSEQYQQTGMPRVAVQGPTYYVDCSASVNGDGTKNSPWNSLSGPDAFTFDPGDQLLFKRGTTCQGTLFPLGSGSEGAPIIIDAYGVGAQPVIDGGYNEEAVLLANQQYWEIRNLEIVGGYQYGIWVWGDLANSSLNHFHFINLNVHGAHFVSSTIDDSGEVVLQADGVHQLINDVLIDGVVAHDSHVATGIWVEASGDYNTSIQACIQEADHLLGNKIIIQNSTAHDIDGSGIVLLTAKHGLMQHNVVYNTGFCTTNGCATTGQWQQCCHNCTIQYNESYANHTPNIFDGGDFDIDAYNNHNLLQYNYGHDSDGYCIVHIPSEGAPNNDNIIRYNICSNNGRNPASATVGDFWVVSSTNSFQDGVQIYNNVSYWNPAVNVAAFDSAGAVFSGTDPAFFKNNIIYSTVPNLINSNSDFALDHNIYWTVGGSSPTWQFNGTSYTDFAAYQAASGQDAHSFNTDPMLKDPTYHDVPRPTTAFTLQPGSPARGAGTNVCSGISGCSMGKHDFFGNPLPSGSGFDIGAQQAP